MVSEGCRVSRLFQVQEFAQLAGITVRALHHYDRLGLLKPRRAGSGYRLYCLHDLERLEQIVALKFLGIPLKQIQNLLDRDPLALPDALRLQRRMLEDKRRLLDRAIRAIREAEERPDAAVLQKIIEVIEMENDANWMKKYHSDEGWAKIQERRPQWSPELQERVTREWTELFRDVEAALGEDPAGAKAQALAVRWKRLIEEFTGGDREISAGVKNVWADRPNWPAGFQQQAAPFTNPKVWEFMSKALGWKA
jgi:MerR family transcriptional regulator, thiopeptide resistance regulator